MELTREELELYLLEAAHYLGGWKVDRRDEYRLYLKGEGVTISVRTAGYKKSEQGRLFFTGLLPVGYCGSLQDNSISVSFSRSPKAVANDIKKRLLPQLKKATIKANEHLTLKAKESDALDHIAHIVEGVGFDDVRRGYYDQEYTRSINAKRGQASFKFDIAKHSSQIHIDHLDNDKLIKLAFFLKSL